MVFYYRGTAVLAVAILCACSGDESAGRKVSTEPAGHTSASDSVRAQRGTPGPQVPSHVAHGEQPTESDTAHAAHRKPETPTAGAHARHERADGARGVPHADHEARPAASDRGHAAHGQRADRVAGAHADHAQRPVRADTAHAGHAQRAPGADSTGMQQHPGMEHEMFMRSFGSGWMLLGMAQAFPAVTIGLPSEEGTPLERKGVYLTQPAIMLNTESPGSRLVLRTTLNFEGITQPWGELTFGGWGEGFLDKRHPHTLLHEVVLSYNVFPGRQTAGYSVSLGKGFAPFGTDDPMSRPVLKYPTNHHLSQILERWLVMGAVLTHQWSAEAGVFGGAEPNGPYDLSNIGSFPDSWSARITRRFGPETVGTWPWELSASLANVKEETEAGDERTWLFNAAARHEKKHDFGQFYALMEASASDPEFTAGFFSLLAEARLARGSHQPYARLEYASRPEFVRDGSPATTGFFRYDHHDIPIGATRWFIATAGYGFEATRTPYSIRPFMEAQYNVVRPDRGGISPESLYGRSNFRTASLGLRIFLGGEPMRMGTYGVLDPMTAMHRMMMSRSAMTEHQH
jgi:hypothetical protein